MHCVHLSESFPTNLLLETDSYANEYLAEKISLDTAENEPCKVCPLSQIRQIAQVDKYARRVLSGRQFRAPAVVPLTRSLPKRSDRGYRRNGFVQVAAIPDATATPALLDFEKVYTALTGEKFYGQNEFRIHTKPAAFQFLLKCLVRQDWDLLMCTGWNSLDPIAEYRAQTEFLREFCVAY